MEVNITGQYKVIYFQRINSTIIASLKITLTSVCFPVKDGTAFSEAAGPDPGWLPRWDKKTARAQRSQFHIFSLSIAYDGRNDSDQREKRRVILTFWWLGILGTSPLD